LFLFFGQPGSVAMVAKGQPVVELSELKVRFGKVVLRRRLETQLAQDEFAEKAGIHRTTLSLIERGKHLPNLNLIRLLAKAFGVKMSVLVAEAEEGNLDNVPTLLKGRPTKTKVARRSRAKPK
jgi:transcriptional regulator with XRE-family HTH domain